MHSIVYLLKKDPQLFWALLLIYTPTTRQFIQMCSHMVLDTMTHVRTCGHCTPFPCSQPGQCCNTLIYRDSSFNHLSNCHCGSRSPISHLKIEWSFLTTNSLFPRPSIRTISSKMPLLPTIETQIRPFLMVS